MKKANNVGKSQGSPIRTGVSFLALFYLNCTGKTAIM
jgi:hypothetical protein